MGLRRAFTVLGCVVLAFVCAGCATGNAAHFAQVRTDANVYVAPNPPDIRKIAIMPFKAPTELIGESVSDLFITEMLRAGRYQVVERSQMGKVLGEAELALSGLSDRRAIEIGEMLGAEAVVVGTVSEYGQIAQRGKTYPVVGVSARLVDCTSGGVVWSVDASERASRSDKGLSQHARTVVHEMCSALYQQWRR